MRLNVIWAKLSKRQYYWPLWAAVSQRVGVWGGQGFCARVPCILQLGFGGQLLNCSPRVFLSANPCLSSYSSKYFVSHCLISVKVPGGCRSQGCRGHRTRSVQTARGSILSTSQAHLLLTSLKNLCRWNDVTVIPNYDAFLQLLVIDSKQAGCTCFPSIVFSPANQNIAFLLYNNEIVGFSEKHKSQLFRTQRPLSYVWDFDVPTDV